MGGARYHPSVQEWQRPPVQVSDSVDASGRSSAHIGRSRIWNRILDSCFDNSDRREYGRGIAGQIFRRTFKESVRKEKDVSCIMFSCVLSLVPLIRLFANLLFITCVLLFSETSWLLSSSWGCCNVYHYMEILCTDANSVWKPHVLHIWLSYITRSKSSWTRWVTTGHTLLGGSQQSRLSSSSSPSHAMAWHHVASHGSSSQGRWVLGTWQSLACSSCCTTAHMFDYF